MLILLQDSFLSSLAWSQFSDSDKSSPPEAELSWFGGGGDGLVVTVKNQTYVMQSQAGFSKWAT